MLIPRVFPHVAALPSLEKRIVVRVAMSAVLELGRTSVVLVITTPAVVMVAVIVVLTAVSSSVERQMDLYLQACRMRILYMDPMETG